MLAAQENRFQYVYFTLSGLVACTMLILFYISMRTTIVSVCVRVCPSYIYPFGFICPCRTNACAMISSCCNVSSSTSVQIPTGTTTTAGDALGTHRCAMRSSPPISMCARIL